MNPWGQAVFDTLGSVVSQNVLDEVVERGILEVLPLTHIRGRSLHDAFVIVDEAQSLERNVLLTVLSRIGQNSRVVLTHDVAQRDNLRVGRHDGVASVIETLKGHALFAHITLTRSERRRSPRSSPRCWSPTSWPDPPGPRRYGMVAPDNVGSRGELRRGGRGCRDHPPPAVGPARAPRQLEFAHRLEHRGPARRGARLDLVPRASPAVRLRPARSARARCGHARELAARTRRCRQRRPTRCSRCGAPSSPSSSIG